MYLFPTEEKNDQLNTEIDDRILIEDNTLTLKTYGLPMIFWGYLAAILSVIAIMWLSSKSIIEKMLTYNDPSLTFLAYLVRGILIGGPIALLGFYFYEKFLIKKNNKLIIIHRIFYLPIFKKELTLDSQDSLIVEHFMESPNMAKMKNKTELRGFENKGYFELKALINNKRIFVDRSSRKADLLKLKDLLSKY